MQSTKIAVLVCGAWLVAGPQASPPRGGILRVAQRAEPKTFNPVTALDAPSREVLRRMHADLISIDRSTFLPVPSLAESWKRSADGRTFELLLRPNVRFSDGHPFTAQDVAFSFAVYQDPAVASPQRDLLISDGKPIVVRVKDPRRVEFELPRPLAAGDRLFDSIAMLPRHQLEAEWKAGRFGQCWPLATPPAQMAVLGPFRLKEYRPGEALMLERNPYYWRKDQPYLDGIEFRFLADEDAQLARFTAGHLDVLNRLATPAVQFLRSRNLPVADLGPSLEYNFVCFRLAPGDTKPWSRLALRRALSAAVDRAAMARLVYQNRAAPIWGPVSPGNTLWFEPPARRPNHDLAEARRLLQADGFSWHSDGHLLAPDGKAVQFSLLVSSSSAERIQMANLITADWKELGVDAQLVTLELRSLIDRVLNKRDFDAVLLGLGGGDADPNSDMNVWLSSGGMHLWNPNQSTPATPWEAELDRLMRAQMLEVDGKKRKTLYRSALRLIDEHQPLIFLVSPHVTVAFQNRVGNARPARLDHYTLWNAQELYLRTSP